MDPSEPGRPAARQPAGVQSVERALGLLEMLARGGGRLPLSELADPFRAAARDGAPAARDAGRRRVRPPGRRPAVRPGHRAAAAGRRRDPAARRLGAAVPGAPGRGERGDREPGRAGGRPDRLPGAGPGPAPDADVHRGRPAGAPAHAPRSARSCWPGRTRPQVRRVLARLGLPARTPRSITDPAGLPRRARRGPPSGWAVDDEEEEEGVRCLAVPVGPGPTAVAALSVSGPASRLAPRQP